MLTRSDAISCDGLRTDLVADAQVVLADLDGCLVAEGQAFSDAAAFVNACGERLWVISNNSTDTARTLAASLSEIGFAIAPNRILLAGEQTLHHLKAAAGGLSIGLYASDALQHEARVLGLRLVQDRPDVVVLCRDLGVALPDIETIAAQIRTGARLWVSNTDLTHPALDGRPIPETGALLAALEAVAGPLAFDCIGKPHTHMAQIALDKSGIAARDAVFVGDNAATDGALAAALGMPFLHLVRGAVG